MTAADGALRGRRVVVTRAAGQGEDLLARLRAAGATALALPTIAIAPPEDWAPLDAALGALGSYHGLIFTSANGVKAFFARGSALGLRLERPSQAWVCAIGPATARALEARGWRVEIVPESYVAEGVVAALENRELRGRRILLPRAAVARDVLPRALRERGAEVEVVAAYRTTMPAGAEEQAQRLFPSGAGTRPDAVLFSSSSTAVNFARLLGADYRHRLEGVVLAAIGPITSATLRELRLEPAIEASEYTSAGLAAALSRYYQGLGGA